VTWTESFNTRSPLPRGPRAAARKYLPRGTHALVDGDLQRAWLAARAWEPSAASPAATRRRTAAVQAQGVGTDDGLIRPLELEAKTRWVALEHAWPLSPRPSARLLETRGRHVSTAIGRRSALVSNAHRAPAGSAHWPNASEDDEYSVTATTSRHRQAKAPLTRSLPVPFPALHHLEHRPKG